MSAEACTRVTHGPTEIAFTVGLGKDTERDVVAAVVAASCAPGVVDYDGHILWETARPAHFCGSGHGDRFVGAYDVTEVAGS